MRQSIAILGLGTFGIEIIKELKNYEYVDIIGIDLLKENAIKAGEYIKNVFISDITDLNALKELGLENVDDVILSIGKNIPQTILATINLEKLKIKNIIVRLDDDNHLDVLTKLGANRIIIPQKDAAKLLVHQLVHKEFINIIKITNNYCIVVIAAKTNMQIDKIKNIKILLIKRENEELIPNNDEIIKKQDIVYAFGLLDDLRELQRQLNNE